MPIQQIFLPCFLVFPICRLRNDICRLYGHIRDFLTLLGLNTKVIFAKAYVFFPPVNRFPDAYRIGDGINLFAKAVNKIMRQNGVFHIIDAIVKHFRTIKKRLF